MSVLRNNYVMSSKSKKLVLTSIIKRNKGLNRMEVNKKSSQRSFEVIYNIIVDIKKSLN